MRTRVWTLSMCLALAGCFSSSSAQAQQEVVTKSRAHRSTAFGFGPFGSTKRDNGAMMYGLSYGKNWEASASGEIRFTLLGAANSDTQHGGAGLGYGYLFDAGDISPVAGGQFGVGYDRYKKDGDTKSAAGFAGGVFGGMRFLHTTDVQLELLLSYDMLFSGDTPGVYGLQLRILF